VSCPGRFGGPFAFRVLFAGPGRLRESGRMSIASEVVTVQVLLFARFAELLGTEQLVMELPRPASVQAVLDRLLALPGGAGLPRRPLVALNHAQSSPDALLEDGDEVAVLPPLAGG
jgi:molybdopterin converting factor small subunit